MVNHNVVHAPRVTTIFLCDDCNRAVEPTAHSVVDSREEGLGHRTYYAFEELRCPFCCDLVHEEIACIECKEALPESGCDHCEACLAAIDAPSVVELVQFAVAA
jgi:hypothetical protein